MIRVFITGGAGYLGCILCEHLLAAGHDVTVLDNLMFGPAALCNSVPIPASILSSAMRKRIRGCDAGGQGGCDHSPGRAGRGSPV